MPNTTAKTIPDGLWRKCKQCGVTIYTDEMKKNHWVCGNCDHHHRLTANERASILFDEDQPITEIATEVRAVDFLQFKDDISYQERLQNAQKGDARRDSVAAFRGCVKGREIVAVIFDFTFMGGSMGSVAGERFVRGVEEAVALNIPFVSFTASGGARMQEGMVSLLQMAKTTAALTDLQRLRLPHISVLTDPTTGGVAASFALIGDIIIAEPKALIGFAGPRVIKETVREELPEGFQRSEFLLNRGAIDMITDRRDMRDTLFRVLTMLTPERH
ncbi:acetyl-CoA carboxylase, carboxyltransferase subunit beta [Candidatus Persebacteraceae bacterium Df01]|uniref:Acetyl-coenzyme A carboxylase carboxyl transferase subunit beta n=1 Tax=Candidatus Doriopsillibacter californiensis TaxID=2970740 RepID=A0ABT7QL42_9GAMM|nr:acetyl-CoA carboxylase, carboxyltransferase subunit beta [Candidatus Persebacteraceae bacterium Df01]